MAPRKKVWDLPLLADFADLTTKEFLAKHSDWNGSQLRNARTRAGVNMTAAAQRRSRAEASASLKLADVGFTKEMAATMIASEIASATGLTLDQVEKRRQAKGWHGTRPEPAVEFDESLPDRMTWDAFSELFDAVAAVKDVETKYDPTRMKIGVRIPDDKPIGIVFTGDWQISSEGVDLRLWRSDMDLLHAYHREQGGLYAVGLGDYASHLGILDHGGSQNRDILKSGSQFTMMQQFFHLTKGLFLVLLAGCHDTFVEKKGAIDTVARYCELSDARHASHGAQVDITVGKEKYVTRLRHKYRYNSSLNEANSQRRQAEMEGPADIIAHGHRHTSFTFEGVAAGQDALMLRSGSYQIHDSFSRQQIGNVAADPRQPMAILWPGQHKIWSCRDFKDGLDFLTSLRQTA